MRRVLALSLLGIAIVVCTALAASESLRNRTGSTATAVTVTFSKKVTITGYNSSVFTTQEPTGKAASFRFNGGQLEDGGRFMISWSPSDASILDTQWEVPAAPEPAAPEPAAPLTYEQIMAQIAHYPGPEEPLYVPAEGEQVWLTDLEGHADIYDNDSIKINYAPGFDKSQITRIDVYRNGVKMRFLPPLLDILTNEQMKTFDGNPAEHSPVSSHTDHAIFGYEYRFDFYVQSPSGTERRTLTLPETVSSPVKWHPVKAYAHLGGWDFLTGADFEERLHDIAAAGFNGVALGINYHLASLTAWDVFPLYGAPGWGSTATPTLDQLRGILERIQNTGLDLGVEFRMWLNVAGIGGFGCLEPREMSRFMDDYADLLIEQLAELAEEFGVTYLTPFTETTGLMRSGAQLEAFFSRIDPEFDAQFGFEMHSEAMIGISQCHEEEVPYDEWGGDFWGWSDDRGQALAILWSGWQRPWETQTDQRLSVIVPGFVKTWLPARDYYRRAHPQNFLGFGELGVMAGDGVSMGRPWDILRMYGRLDEQERSDVWAAYLIGCAYLGLDGFLAWDVNAGYAGISAGSFGLLPDYPAFRVIRALLGP